MIQKYIEGKVKHIEDLAKSRFKVQIVADSLSPNGKRLTTFLVRYPRFITPEVLTHRMLSRNSSSSRAIPAKLLRKQVMNEPMLPVSWGANNPGMQSKSQLPPYKALLSYLVWIGAAKLAGLLSLLMEKVGVHKQIVNRITEFAQPVNVVITATEWANFFALRYHPDAQPEFQYLAGLMYDALEKHTPTKLKYGEWHLPFVARAQLEGQNREDLETLIKVSVARCARTSYRTHDGRPSTVKEDLALYDRLINHDPKHASPAEHQALCAAYISKECESNLKGWVQYRKILPNECIKSFGFINDEKGEEA